VVNKVNSTPISQPVAQEVKVAKVENQVQKVETRVQQPAYTQPVVANVATVASTPSSGIRMLVSLYSYDATEENELTFGEGEVITLLEANESGWWKGRLANGSEGLFPSNFVEDQGKAASGGGGGEATANANGVTEIMADFRSLYDYDAEDDTEITIKENELLFVESEKDGWYYGYNKSTPSVKGNFPSNFVERC